MGTNVSPWLEAFCTSVARLEWAVAGTFNRFLVNRSLFNSTLIRWGVTWGFGFS
jgi:hypothetical protein